MEHIENGAAEQQRLIITEQEAGQRADVGLAAMLELTRSNMQKLLEMLEDDDDVQNVWHSWES